MAQPPMWQCRNCGKQTRSTTPPTPQGVGSCPNNPPTKNHVWEKIG
jgi:hypothetical protein